MTIARQIHRYTYIHSYNNILYPPVADCDDICCVTRNFKKFLILYIRHNIPIYICIIVWDKFYDVYKVGSAFECEFFFFFSKSVYFCEYIVRDVSFTIINHCTNKMFVFY